MINDFVLTIKTPTALFVTPPRLAPYRAPCFTSWSRWRDLNPRPLPYQGSALPLSYIGIAIVNLRAEDGAQTRDPQLGRLMLYRLSYFRSLRLSHCGRRWIRTTEGINQQIYSLPHLATLVFALISIFSNCHAACLSLLSDSNQRPRDYKSRALAN